MVPSTASLYHYPVAPKPQRRLPLRLAGQANVSHASSAASSLRVWWKSSTFPQVCGWVEPWLLELVGVDRVPLPVPAVRKGSGSIVGRSGLDAVDAESSTGLVFIVTSWGLHDSGRSHTYTNDRTRPGAELPPPVDPAITGPARPAKALTPAGRQGTQATLQNRCGPSPGRVGSIPSASATCGNAGSEFCLRWVPARRRSLVARVCSMN